MRQRHATSNKQQCVRLAVSCCVLLAACCLTGCVHRSLTIRTDPPGATVYLNDELKGQTPVTFDFLWYGTHRVMVKKAGFERIEDHKTIRAPLYLWIPFDFAAELLPLTIRDAYTWDYALTPVTAPPAPVPPQPEGAQAHDPG